MPTKQSWKNDKDKSQSRTDWHRVVTFGKLADYTRTLPSGTHLFSMNAFLHPFSNHLERTRCDGLLDLAILGRQACLAVLEKMI